MSTETVALHLGSGAPLPKEVVLPMKLVATLKLKHRRLLIREAEQEVPEAVKTWMQSTPQYKGWFADELIIDQAASLGLDDDPELVEPEDEGAHVTLPPPEAVVDDPHAERAPEADALSVQSTDVPEVVQGSDDPLPYPNAAWSARWNVPDLRAYAKDAEVKLLSSDLKDDILAKLRAANKPEQGV